MTIRIRILLIIICAAIAMPAGSARAENPQDVFEIAKLCHAYNSGKIQEVYTALSGAQEGAIVPEDLQARIIEEYNAANPDAARMREEEKGIVSARQAYKKTIIAPQTRNAAAENPHFETVTTVGMNSQDAESSSDRSFDEKGYYLANHMSMNFQKDGVDHRLDTDVTGYRNSHQDLRLRRATYAQTGRNHRFLLGDLETSLSRYVMRGTYYRGASLNLFGDKNIFQCLAGAVPNYNAEDEEYLYKRRVIGVRDEFRMRQWWTTAFAFMNLKDKDGIRSLSDNYNPKENQVGSWGNTFVLSPYWQIVTESAYSMTSEDRTKEDFTIRDRDLRGTAHFVSSNINWQKLQIVNSYERISYGFRSYTDLSSDTTFYSALSPDREIIYSMVNYYPTDNFFMGVDLSRNITNVSGRDDIETLEQRRYGAYARYQLPLDLPRLNWRSYIYDNTAKPGPDQAQDKTLAWTHEFALYKNIFDTDMTLSYENKQFFDATATYPNLSDIYTLELSRDLIPDKINVDCRYSFEDSNEIMDSSRAQDYKEQVFNVNFGVQPFESSTLFFNAGYELDHIRYYLAPSSHLTTQSLVWGVTWPVTTKFMGRDLTLSPYGEIIKSFKTDSTRDKLEFIGKLEGTYFLKDSTLSLVAEYRNSREDDEPYTDTVGAKEFRIFLTYRTKYDFK
jgi:hypothetical protein